MKHEDDDLRRRFAALREQDERDRPGFSQTRALALARSETGSRGSPLAAVAAATLVLLTLVVGREPQPPGPSLAEWRAPTDFLLDTPGREVLAAWPSLELGAWTGSVPAPRLAPPDRR